MALFKITRGAESELPSTKHDGYAYFCTDTGSFYIDYKENESSTDIKRMKITAGKADRLTSSTQVGSATEPVYFSTNGVPVKCTYQLNATVPSNAKFTDTDTKVTSVGNHYTPAANNASQLSADAANGSSATWNSTNFVTGVNLQRDAKGHVVGVTVDSAKMPANPNVDTNTSHTHSAGVGLVAEGTDNILSGEVKYKAKLKNETALNVDSVAPTSVGGTYPVVADKSGNLAVSTPNATTSAKGVVQLTSTIDTSTNKAATPAAVKTAYDLADTAKSAAESVDNKLSGYKTVQTAVTDPTASSTSSTFIATISQDTNGKITATKKTVTSGTTSTAGIVKLSSSTSSTSEALAATPKAVKAAYDLADTVNSNLEGLTITANASDDDVVVLTGQGGVHSVSYSASHAISGVTAGDYTKVSVNDKGHVTSGSNPTTLGGYGITDAYTKTEINTELNDIDGQLSSINSELDGSIKSLSVSGKVITYTKNDGSTGTITTQDTNTDTKVSQNAVITTAKEYPVILGYSDATTKVTNVVNKASTLTYNPSTQILTAPTFKGNLDGIAETAEYANEAGKAIKDGSDRNIVSTYETKEDASTKLTEAKGYTDTQIGLLINDSDPATLNSIYDLGEAIKDNQDAIEALNSIAAGKADATTVNNHIANKNNPHEVTYTQVGAAPTNHASTGTTYGTGTNNNYGHVKLSDSTSSTSSTSGGIAATPYAVNQVYELANTIETNFEAHKHTVSHTPEGTVSKPTFTGSAVTSGANTGTAFSAAPSGHKHKFTPSGTVSQPTFTGSAVTSGKNSGTGVSAGSGTHTHTFLPAGTISTPTFTGTNKNTSAHTSTYTATVAPNEHTHSFTPAGTISAPTFTGSTGETGTNTGDAFSAAPGGHKHSVTAAGTISTPTFTGSSVTSGNNSTITGPTLSASIANKCFTVTLSAGSYTHTHSVVASGTVSQPTFTGTAVTSGANNGTNGSVAPNGHKHSFTPSGTNSAPTFTGTAGTSGKNSGTGVSVSKSTHIHPFTPVGTISQPTFTGSEGLATGGPSATVTAAPNEHTHSVTASGSVSQPTFTGTEGTTDTNDGTNGSVAPSGHKHSVTAAGTISQPTFTGTAATLTTSTAIDN